MVENCRTSPREVTYSISDSAILAQQVLSQTHKRMPAGVWDNSGNTYKALSMSQAQTTLIITTPLRARNHHFSPFTDEELETKVELPTVTERVEPGSEPKESDYRACLCKIHLHLHKFLEKINSQSPPRVTCWIPLSSLFNSSSWLAIFSTDFSKSFNFFSSTSSSGLF